MGEVLGRLIRAMEGEVHSTPLADDAKHTAVWCVRQLPALYDKFCRTSESRYGDEITRLVRAALQSLADGNGNRIRGDVHTVDTAGSYITSDKRVIGTVGVSDLVIVDSPDALLLVENLFNPRSAVAEHGAVVHPAIIQHRFHLLPLCGCQVEFALHAVETGTSVALGVVSAVVLGVSRGQPVTIR